ncbi:hypothetical protein GCM10009850_028310 [Nonomuraea monospora]|uniref:Uncharacterized protein n=1 Tax=Nonomuraea monospora TaxID=568818 RepID=A0ABN3CDC1_9ACTN
MTLNEDNDQRGQAARDSGTKTADPAEARMAEFGSIDSLLNWATPEDQQSLADGAVTMVTASAPPGSTTPDVSPDHPGPADTTSGYSPAHMSSSHGEPGFVEPEAAVGDPAWQPGGEPVLAEPGAATGDPAWEPADSDAGDDTVDPGSREERPDDSVAEPPNPEWPAEAESSPGSGTSHPDSPATTSPTATQAAETPPTTEAPTTGTPATTAPSSTSPMAQDPADTPPQATSPAEPVAPAPAPTVSAPAQSAPKTSTGSAPEGGEGSGDNAQTSSGGGGIPSAPAVGTPTTAAPTTGAPTTAAPTTGAPTTAAPTTGAADADAGKDTAEAEPPKDRAAILRDGGVYGDWREASPSTLEKLGSDLAPSPEGGSSSPGDQFAAAENAIRHATPGFPGFGLVGKVAFDPAYASARNTAADYLKHAKNRLSRWQQQLTEGAKVMRDAETNSTPEKPK